MECDGCEDLFGIFMVICIIGAFIFYGVDVASITWLILTSTHKLIWGLPVIGSQIDLHSIGASPNMLYNRQIYGNIEIAFLGLVRRCTVEPPEFIKVVTAIYLWSGVSISVAYSMDRNNPLYRLHDAFGLLLACTWTLRTIKQSVPH